MVGFYDLEVSLQGLMPPSANNFIGAAPGLRLLDLTFLCYEEVDDGAVLVMQTGERFPARDRYSRH